jgi:hypothetical protein|tara:strand:- start:15496 stop:15966 length:471 start_codon:yes stop_codon:yes gene_type:complete
MATPAEIIKRLTKLARDLPFNTVKTSHKIGDKIRDRARANAPSDKGTLRGGIKNLKRKNGATVFTYDPAKRVFGTDRLAEWANSMVSFEFRSTSFQPFYRIPQSVRYGKSAVTSTGKQVRWTAKPGYFSNAVNKELEDLPTHLRKALRFSIGGRRI